MAFFSLKTYLYRIFLVQIRNYRLKIDPCTKLQPDWTKDKGARISTWNDTENSLMTSYLPHVRVPNFGGLSGSEDRGGGDNSFQFINFGRVGDKSFKEWRQKIGGWKCG